MATPLNPQIIPQPKPPTGTVAWALGFLAYVPIPFANVLIAGVVQLVVGLRQRRQSPLAAANGVRAANWGLTQLCYLPLLAAVIVLSVSTGTPSGDGVTPQPWTVPIVITVLVLYFVLGILQLVYAIVGTVACSSGKEVRLPVIPFIRARRRDASTASAVSWSPPHA